VDFLRYVTALAIFIAVSLVVVVCGHTVLRRHTMRKAKASSGSEE
jgi:hypothetical protein